MPRGLVWRASGGGKGAASRGWRRDVIEGCRVARWGGRMSAELATIFQRCNEQEARNGGRDGSVGHLWHIGGKEAGMRPGQGSKRLRRERGEQDFEQFWKLSVRQGHKSLSATLSYDLTP